MTKQLKTLKDTATYQEIIKKSRFTVHVTRADTVEEAMEFLELVREPDANHNCWAYKIGDLYRFSDDGEPGGTAGRPMFMAIEQQGYDHVMAVVIRYFGGIKLGAGGLARTYGGTTGKCLQQAEAYIVQNRVVFKMIVPFDKTGIVYQFLDGCTDLDRLAEDYTEHGLEFKLRTVESQFASFSQQAANASAGSFDIQVIDTVFE